MPKGTTPQFAVHRDDIVRELASAVAAVEKKTTIPILGNVMIEATGSELKITATDLEIGIATACVASVKEEGVFTLPAKRLLDYLRLLPAGSVDFSIGSNLWASIKSDRSRTRIPGMSHESFPELPAGGEPVCRIKLSALAYLASRTTFCVSREESRFSLNGSLLEIHEDGTARMVATDGHRLGIANAKCEPSGTFKLLVPRKVLTMIPHWQAAASEDITVVVSADDNHIFFDLGGRHVLSRKMSGNFPDYQRVLPKELPHAVDFKREEMAGTLSRVRAFADERARAVKLHFIPGEGVKVFSSVMESGESEELVPCEVASEMQTGFNADYVLQHLGAIEAETVQISYRDANNAAVLRPVGAEDSLCVIMPMRV